MMETGVVQTSTSVDLLGELADHLLKARETALALDHASLCVIVDVALLEVGREIARTLPTGDLSR